jgi:UDP-3-O-[3-hydroxymyristoyl] glucosamine N-acyltransferase
LKLKDLAERLACRLEGDGELDIQRVTGIEHAQRGDVTFLANPKYRHHLASTQASAVIIGLDELAEGITTARLRAERPAVSFAEAVRLLAHVATPGAGIDSTARVASDAVVHPSASIGAFVTVGAGAAIGARTVVYPHVTIGAGAALGDDCVVHAQVSIRERVRIGHRVVLQDGAVIGSDGFGFVKQGDGTHLKIPQLADVVIEDDVEIGANTTVDRPAVGETRIAAGTKIDNLVQVGHGVSIGRRALLAAQVGIAGSSVLEDDVVLAGQVGVAGHLTLGKGVVASAQTGIPNSVPAGQFVSGYPAIPNRDWLKSSAVFRQLPELRKRVAELERLLAELQDKLAACPPPQDHT